ncbi:MAG: hypothetical protein QG587_1477, partial [Chloroflexota bacterium]|nr:hypothetical protein [Chloroflexota bacterium]
MAELTPSTATPSRHRRLKRFLVILGVGLAAGHLFLKPVGIAVPVLSEAGTGGQLRARSERETHHR